MTLEEFKSYCQDKPVSLSEVMECLGVKIPKIQREYAQGRDTHEAASVRRSFLLDIINKAIKGNDGLELDFVFGKVEIVEGHVDLLPVDGQQRLTTLMLMYWLLGERVEGWRFRYESRRIASSFVEKLLSNRIPVGSCVNPSVWIQNQKWFVRAWLDDPTVSGMLRALDTCSLLLKETDVKIAQGASAGLGRVKFYLNLQEGIDADESYRKMNARGKALADWENVKVSIEDVIAHNLEKTATKEGACYANWESKINGDWARAIERLAENQTKSSYGDDPEKYIDEIEMLTNRVFRNLFDFAVFDRLALRIDDFEGYYKACWECFVEEMNNDSVPDEKKHKLGYWLFGEGLLENKVCAAISLEKWRWKELKGFVLAAFKDYFLEHGAKDADYNRRRIVKQIDSPEIIAPDVLRLACNLYEFVGSPLAFGTWVEDRNKNILWCTGVEADHRTLSTQGPDEFLFAETPSLAQALRYVVLSSILEDASLEAKFNITLALGYIDSVGQSTISDDVDINLGNYAKCRRVVDAILAGNLDKSLEASSVGLKWHYVYADGLSSVERAERIKEVLTVESNLSFLRGDIRILFCRNILLQERVAFISKSFVAQNEDVKLEFIRKVFERFGSAPKDTIQVQPQNGETATLLFARALRSKEYCDAAALYMDNPSATSHDVQMWLRHLNELIKSNGHDGRHIAIKKGSYPWHCLTTAVGYVKQDAYRLDLSANECANRSKLADPYNIRYHHGDVYLPAKDGSHYYKVSDASWWNDQDPPRYEMNGEGDEVRFSKIEPSENSDHSSSNTFLAAHIDL